jgi:hypothetical protein
MGIAHPLFFSSNTDKPTLHRRTTPNQEQFTLLQTRWNDLAEFIKSYLSDVTGCPVKTWIQGSYKWGTLIRPVRKDDEFDVDLGTYVLWSGTTELFAPADLKAFAQEALFAYAAQNDGVTGVSDPPKERCERIHYKQNFHVDTPVYHLDETQDRRRLATQTKGWEATDPKTIWIWFKAQAEDRDLLRRLIRYLKTWAALTFVDEVGRPSSIMLTVLATEAYQSLGTALGNGDDEILTNMIGAMHARLSADRRVKNPIDRGEDLNRLSADHFSIFLRSLGAFSEVSLRAVAATHPLTAAMLWSDVFGFLFPMPEEEPSSPVANLPATTLVPEIVITATVRKTGQHIAAYRNAVPPIPKECSLRFEIENWNMIPPDATIEWTVRNDGSEAENANDLGHVRARGRRERVVDERTLYEGRQYMDCIIRRWGQVIGRRRVPVQIQRHVYPLRNSPRPAYANKR